MTIRLHTNGYLLSTIIACRVYFHIEECYASGEKIKAHFTRLDVTQILQAVIMTH